MWSGYFMICKFLKCWWMQLYIFIFKFDICFVLWTFLCSLGELQGGGLIIFEKFLEGLKFLLSLASVDI